MPELYTIFRGTERDFSIETGFGRWKDDFVKARKAIMLGERLHDDHVASLYVFIASMITRQPAHTMHMRDRLAAIARRMNEITINPNVPPFRPLAGSTSGQSLSRAQVQQKAEDPLSTWFVSTVGSYITVIAQGFGIDILVTAANTRS